MTIIDPPPMVPQVQGGKLRALAVLAKERFPDLPDVPTMTEAGFPDVNVSLWSGFFVPAGTPKPIVDKLHKELSAVIMQSDVNDKLRGHGGEADRRRHRGFLQADRRRAEDVERRDQGRQSEVREPINPRKKNINRHGRAGITSIKTVPLDDWRGRRDRSAVIGSGASRRQ